MNLVFLFFFVCFFFFNDTATTEIYTFSLHDALPICSPHTLSPSWSSPPVPLSTDVERGNEVGDWAPGSGASYWSPLSAYAERGTGGEDKGRGEGERSGRSGPGLRTCLSLPLNKDASLSSCA